MVRQRPTRFTTAGAAVGGLALVLAACSQGSATRSEDTSDAAGESATIRYMNFSANDGNEENLDEIVAAFEEAHDGIEVEVETYPFDEYFTVLQTAVAGGTVADTFELNYENFVTYAENGSLAPLDDIDGSAYQDSLLEAFNRDGAQYGVPTSFSNVVLFYNETLFEEAGVDPPTDEWTWEDEREAAEQLTDADAGIWGDYQPVSFHEFYKTLAQAGGEFLDDDASEARFNSPEGVRAATWLVEKSGTSMPTEADGAGTPDFDSDLFADGKLAMWHTGIWMFGAMADVDFEWDVVVEPGDAEKASAMFANGAVVSESTEHPEAAQAWIDFLAASDVTTQVRLDASWELPPVADESKLSDYLDVTPPDNRQAVLDSLDNVVLPPVIERQQEMQDIVTEELESAAAGRKSVEDALDDAEERVNALL
ncbi:sugar ABC transporter substrate-binding protein [Actinobacteria bacterium YIM 96077]|uniref:Sugar ABC transporter substrate-binding protein n=1 Tax=Phytoactinopolyspora halophila TaxID=1981511 RepID=A0A329R250_9ACTN|nr:sugar ABC transporter substrate-binding protein [Phytoactinopolyspora halophila]AYY12051.1 sugar ABC transporter substrate-binding protein [Actinobacteria bacterium YIM 96077]RAW18715.1 sugar ABC transporter substrate-binding protein [Phytoactinopolyspora halophila]